MKSAISLGLLLFTAFAHAGTTTCSSSDQRLSYLESVRDTGVAPPHPLPKTVILILDKKVLVRKNTVDKKTGKPLVDFELATREVDKAVNVPSEELEKPQPATGIGYQLDLTRVLSKNGKELYKGVVFCRSFTQFVP